MSANIHNSTALRLVLVGKTGVGKSAAGNAILGEKQFTSKFSPTSVTNKCEKKEGEVAGKHVVVVDTPGLFDTEISNEEATKEIVKCIQMSFPGPHAFLLVVKMGRFTDEEKNTVELIQQVFGEGASKYMMVVFTHRDSMDDGQTVDEFITNSPVGLKQLLESCGNRFLAINGREIKNQDQAKDLLDNVESMVKKNNVQFYANDFYELEEKRKQEAAKHQKEFDDLKKEKEEEIEKMKMQKVAMELILEKQTENNNIFTKKMEDMKKANEDAIKKLEAHIMEKIIQKEQIDQQSTMFHLGKIRDNLCLIS